MENFSSYPDSLNSSPRSRDTDLENSAWDERIINTNYKVKLMCSYGGKIHLRPQDNQLTYVGGDTKILAVDRNIKFLGFISKLSVLCDDSSSDASFKYQLPGEDLDALISVTNDEDLEHMMLEYDRLYRSSAKPARLRLFIFPPLNSNSNSESGIYGSDDSKGRVGKWYEDVLNSGQINTKIDSSSPMSVSERRLKNHPESFIGLDKGQPQPPNLLDCLPSAPPTVMVKTEYKAAVVPEERYVVGETPVTEIQRQIHEFQRMQISSSNDNYYQQKDPLQPPPQRAMATPAANYWPGRNDFFPAGANNPPQQQQQQPMYLIQTQSGVYQTPHRPVTGHVNQPYYGVQGMVPSVYREPPPYDPMTQQAPPPNIQPPQVSGAYASAMVGLARPAAYDLMIQQAPSSNIQPAMVGLARPAAGNATDGGLTLTAHEAARREDYYHFP